MAQKVCNIWEKELSILIHVIPNTFNDNFFFHVLYHRCLYSWNVNTQLYRRNDISNKKRRRNFYTAWSNLVVVQQWRLQNRNNIPWRHLKSLHPGPNHLLLGCWYFKHARCILNIICFQNLQFHRRRVANSYKESDWNSHSQTRQRNQNSSPDQTLSRKILR